MPDSQQQASFPRGMFFLALFFDIIGLIPVLNILTEIIATAIFGFWQKKHAPSIDPLMTIAITKIADIVSLGILPSNIAIVVLAHIKKKVAAKIPASPAKPNKQPAADIA